jgi:hypothetical protein
MSQIADELSAASPACTGDWPAIAAGWICERVSDEAPGPGDLARAATGKPVADLALNGAR